MSFHSTRNGILADDASDDSEVVIGEIDAPPTNVKPESKPYTKLYFLERLKPHLLPPKLLYAWMLEDFK